MSFSSSNTTQQLLGNQDASSILTLYISSLVAGFLFSVSIYMNRDPYPQLPRIGPKGLARLTWLTQKLDFILNAKERLMKGSKQYPDRPYKIFTDMGDVVVVPPSYMEELKMVPTLDFMAAGGDDMHSYIPGFHVFDLEPQFMKALVKNLTKVPGKYEFSHDDVSLLVTRMDSCVFLGEELSKDPAWYKAAADFIHAAFATAYFIGLFPRNLRWYISWFFPPTYLVRQRLNKCKAVLQSYLDKRTAVKAAAAARGEPCPYNGAVEWFEKECSPDHNPAYYQIALNFVAVHTTSDLLFQTLIDIAQHPEVIDPLRKELMEVLRSDGLTKVGLQKLKLMDSCLKESQRRRPVATAFFRRLAMSDIKLSNGLVIKKGTKIVADAGCMQNPSLWENPTEWDPYRFLRMRSVPGQETSANLVTATQAHFGFGYGLHVCPGRFFAASTLKVALAHLLLKYDLTFPQGQRNLKSIVVGQHHMAHPKTRILIASRKPEIDIDCLPV
ncbi:hypothetical protein MCOR25_002029 [Pyricularia grisea]|uniref:Uncharacterized protein n=1 Tax=Pyricularia grisea TaxID=148305 RepID=A0A6P8AMC4_PYRGI|nr:uncharacterized protein PgNI_12438 [Pyricularia grisea]KAI6379153.1 hypothetical protein MCOR25_002029 [Pyricularia grisea]TLD03177.1 hypothetical protein PgNI_12438 [Pyricularia grisea]